MGDDFPSMEHFIPTFTSDKRFGQQYLVGDGDYYPLLPLLIVSFFDDAVLGKSHAFALSREEFKAVGAVIEACSILHNESMGDRLVVQDQS
ncbi:hypothetical protein V6N13_080552 [Hibiscus sabdariffa]|uniref:Uncharacterized protein n=1 Tax=Hibiscus sabdariffa TaxID=183260 RepID=A0ABR2PZ39_9ROSI